eukprot:2237194-Amphidinium_carterae.1
MIAEVKINMTNLCSSCRLQGFTCKVQSLEGMIALAQTKEWSSMLCCMSATMEVMLARSVMFHQCGCSIQSSNYLGGKQCKSRFGSCFRAT